MLVDNDLLHLLNQSLQQSWNLYHWLTLNALIALNALIMDRLFGEFLNRWHPVVLIGNWITFYNQRFYNDSMMAGLWLWLSTIGISFLTSVLILYALSLLPIWFSFPIIVLLASTLLAHRMLYDSVLAVRHSEHPEQAVAMLVSRDTAQMSKTQAYKAAIETYAENLSDGVIAPLIFLLILGLPGIVFYKVINTLDSMVGYRTPRFENYGKISARADDIANWLPARITALLLMLMFKQWRFWQFYTHGKKHRSPNAGHPISAIALGCHCRLGGPTVYFGKLTDKAYFGRTEDSDEITLHHLQYALSRRNLIDSSLLLLCGLLLIILQ